MSSNKSVRRRPICSLLLSALLLLAAAALVSSNASAYESSPPRITGSITGDSFVKISWILPTYSPEVLDHYHIYRAISTESGYQWALHDEVSASFFDASGNPTVFRDSYIDHDVENGIRYDYAVVAVYDIYEGHWSNIWTIRQVGGPPSPPTSVRVFAGSAIVSLVWESPLSDGGFGLTRFEIDRYTIATNGQANFYTPTGADRHYDDITAVNGVTYAYHVHAINVRGTSEPSEVVLATPLTLPSAPNNLNAVGGDREVWLTWMAGDDNGFLNDHYEVLRGEDPGALVYVASVSGFVYRDLNVVNDQTYYYQVRAVDTLGDTGSPTPVISATPSSQPGTPPPIDTTPPSLAVDTPEDGTTTSAPVVTVSGTTEPGVELIVAGHLTYVSADGSFSTGISLVAGTNVFEVMAFDAAGNPTTVTVTVTYNDPLPELNARVDALETGLNSLGSDFAAHVQTQDAQLQAIQVQIGDLTSSIASMQSQLDSLSLRMGSSEARLDSLEAELADLQNEMTSMSGQVQSLQDSMAGILVALGDLQTETDALREDLNQMRVDLATAEDRITQLEMGQTALWDEIGVIWGNITVIWEKLPLAKIRAKSIQEGILLAEQSSAKDQSYAQYLGIGILLASLIGATKLGLFTPNGKKKFRAAETRKRRLSLPAGFIALK